MNFSGGRSLATALDDEPQYRQANGVPERTQLLSVAVEPSTAPTTSNKVEALRKVYLRLFSNDSTTENSLRPFRWRAVLVFGGHDGHPGK